MKTLKKIIVLIVSLVITSACLDSNDSKSFGSDKTLLSFVEPTNTKYLLDYSIDTSKIPQDTITFTNPYLAFVNGKYLLNNKPYSGIVHKVLKGFNVETYSSILNGQLHGTYRSFYPTGEPYEIRKYRNGLSIGRHIGYWKETGNLKFEYNYYDQKKEGFQKNWYSDGSLAYSYNYKNDELDGLQQAWRINGSLYRNFHVKKGIGYGLQKSKTCYEVSDEKVIRQASKIEPEQISQR